MESSSNNRELLQLELEALSMTLNDSELKVEGAEDDTTTSVLVLTRRPSKEEWKDKIIKGIEVTVLPKNLEG